MRFGAFVPQGWRLDLVGVEPGYPQWQAVKKVARRAEAAGYDSLWLYDHFHTIPQALPEATFEAWTALTGLAEATERIRLGHMCGCNIYRPPALMAKISANVDVISNGRLEFAYGAGWYQHETVAYGYSFERPAARIGALGEALEIIKGLWKGGPYQFQGKYYTVGHGRVKDFRGHEIELDGALNYPVPVQKPHPPVWVAGGGEQLTLRVVARHANLSNFFGDAENFERKNRLLDQYCEEIGRDPADIERTLNINAFVGPESEVDRVLAAAGRSPAAIADWKQGAYIGEPAPIAERLIHLRDHARVRYFIVYFPEAVSGESLERFASEVIPLVR
ncbi:MAG: LLM class F420-dependent oxidoreductase [Candidatus Xenobia bacterium]